MKQKIFTIHDKKAEAHFPPFYMPNLSMAIRTFGDMVNNAESQISNHPEDYTLYELGEWEDNDATFTIHKEKISHGNGIEFVPAGLMEEDNATKAKTQNSLNILRN